jgi:hypothetical protein
MPRLHGDGPIREYAIPGGSAADAQGVHAAAHWRVDRTEARGGVKISPHMLQLYVTGQLISCWFVGLPLKEEREYLRWSSCWIDLDRGGVFQSAMKDFPEKPSATLLVWPAIDKTVALDHAWFMELRDGQVVALKEIADVPEMKWAFQFVKAMLSSINELDDEIANMRGRGEKFTRERRAKLKDMKRKEDEIAHKLQEAEIRRLNAALIEATANANSGAKG